MRPEVVRQWQRIFRDTIIVLCGTFMLVYETVVARVVDWQIVAAALTCFGLPPALRVDLRRQQQGDKDDEQQ